MRPLAWPSSSVSRPTIPCETRPKGECAYIVSTSPSLSQTFVLNEVLALERRGLQLRIFSLKDPKDEPVHADTKQVRAKIHYLALHRRWRPALQSNAQTLLRRPGVGGLCVNQQRNGNPKVGYVVSAWPRLSETFILNEVVSVERLGVRLQIFAVKDADHKSAHPKVAEVRAPVTCLSMKRNRKAIGLASLRFFLGQPVRFWQTGLRALRYRRLRVLRCFFQATYLAEILFRESLTHLHAHFAHDPTLVTMFVHYLTGVPYSFTAHAKDIYVKTTPELLRDEAQAAQAVVTCTEYNRRYMSAQIGADGTEKLHCIYHGLDLSQFKFCCPRALDKEPRVILSVARLVEKKGLSDLILAAHILRQRDRSFQVEIVGDGPLRKGLEAQVRRLGLDDRVKFAGPLPHDELCRVYQRACLFTLPCVVAADGDRDGIPNVLLEAMASGVPVVSTPVSGIPEVIDSEREGLLVPPNNPTRLADALDRLLHSAELRERLALAARAKIEACFSVEKNSAQLVSLFLAGRGA